MLNGFKAKLVESKYVDELLASAGKLHGFRRKVYLARKMVFLFVSHKFNLFDYMDEIGDLKEKDYIYSFDGFGEHIKMFVPHYKEDYLQRLIVHHENFYEHRELEYLKTIIPENAVILDIGSNIGNHTVFFGKVCKAKEIYCFEPVRETYDTLCRNVEINGLESVVKTYNVALGTESGKAKIKFFDPNAIGSTQVEASEDGDMKMSKLDDFNFERIDFMKVDIEKYEYNMLLGASKTLRTHSPIIFIEIFDDCFEKVNALLTEYGYINVETVSVNNYIYRKK